MTRLIRQYAGVSSGCNKQEGSRQHVAWHSLWSSCVIFLVMYIVLMIYSPAFPWFFPFLFCYGGSCLPQFHI